MTGPAKPILDIQLNADSFEAFQKKFAAYQLALAEMPRQWAAADAATKESAETADELNKFL